LNIKRKDLKDKFARYPNAPLSHELRRDVEFESKFVSQLSYIGKDDDDFEMPRKKSNTIINQTTLIRKSTQYRQRRRNLDPNKKSRVFDEESFHHNVSSVSSTRSF